MKIKNKYSNKIVCSDLLVEHNDCFSKTILKDNKCLTVTYHKKFWVKLNDKDYYLLLILKDFNKLHRYGLKKISFIYEGIDCVLFKLYSSFNYFNSLFYEKDTGIMYYNDCKIESDDLKSSIESYLSLLNKE